MNNERVDEMKIHNALTVEEINELNSKVAAEAIDLMDNAYFIGKVIDARTGEIIPVGNNEIYNVYLMPNRSTYQADDYSDRL